MAELFLFTNDLFHIVNVREVNFHRFIKLLRCFREGFAAERPEKVAKIKASVKNHPFYIFVENES